MITIGSADTIQRDMRPCMVSVWMSRLRSKRSRTVSATVSMTSAESPPASPLQLGDERELLDVAARHSFGDDPERLLDRHAELLVGDDTLHLALHRLRRALDDDREGTGEAVPGPERRRDHLQCVRELLGEASRAAS